MFGGILSFFVQWLALSQLGSRIPSNSDYACHDPYAYSNPNYNEQSYSFPLKSHWSLLNDFQALPEDEIEAFLPQICNMVLDRALLNDPAVFDHFERIIINKCAECLPFGTRVCNSLKVSKFVAVIVVFHMLLNLPMHTCSVCTSNLILVAMIMLFLQ
jgi:hypothetical protein